MLIFYLSRNNVIVFGPEMLTGWAGQSPDPLAPERAFARCGFPLVGPRQDIRENYIVQVTPNDVELDSNTSGLAMTPLVIVLRVNLSVI